MDLILELVLTASLSFMFTFIFNKLVISMDHSISGFDNVGIARVQFGGGIESTGTNMIDCSGGSMSPSAEKERFVEAGETVLIERFQKITPNRGPVKFEELQSEDQGDDLEVTEGKFVDITVVNENDDVLLSNTDAEFNQSVYDFEEMFRYRKNSICEILEIELDDEIDQSKGDKDAVERPNGEGNVEYDIEDWEEIERADFEELVGK